MVIPIEDAEQLAALRELRARRPQWTDKVFWREVLDSGVVLVEQRHEDDRFTDGGGPPLRRYEPALGWIPV